MVYECDQCSKALPPEVTACPNCGEKFDDVVPVDAELPKRGFSPAPSGLISPVVQDSAPTLLAPPSSPLASSQRKGSYDWLEPPQAGPPRVSGDGSSALRVLGALLLMGGLALAVYFFVVFDTSLAVPKEGGIFGLDRVNNFGLMAERQNGITIGMGGAILGAILIYAGRRK